MYLELHQDRTHFDFYVFTYTVKMNEVDDAHFGRWNGHRAEWFNDKLGTTSRKSDYPSVISYYDDTTYKPLIKQWELEWKRDGRQYVRDNNEPSRLARFFVQWHGGYDGIERVICLGGGETVGIYYGLTGAKTLRSLLVLDKHNFDAEMADAQNKLVVSLIQKYLPCAFKLISEIICQKNK